MIRQPAMSDGRHLFPTTRCSALVGLRSDDAVVRARSLDAIAGAYWRPIYKYLRVKWRRSPQDAEETTQDFFAASFDKDVFDRFDPLKGRFRTWLKTCLDHFVMKHHRAEMAARRGGGRLQIGLDFPAAER